MTPSRPARGVTTRRLASAWDEHGRTDPYWAIIPAPGTRGNRWDVDAFFAAGEADVDGILRQGESLGLTVPRGRALDYGCGAGRLTQALATRFGEAVGVDVAPSMVALAERHNRHPGRCRYRRGDGTGIATLGEGRFDLVISLIVLQHIPPRTTRRILRELVAALTPRGVLAFQYTGRRHDPLRRVLAPVRRALLRSLPGRAARALNARLTGLAEPIEMFGMRPGRVRRLLERAGGRVVAVVPDASSTELESYRYFVVPATNSASASATNSAARPSP